VIEQAGINHHKNAVSETLVRSFIINVVTNIIIRNIKRTFIGKGVFI